MVYNQLIACDVCGAEINLRAQIGYYDIPFNVYCPKCLTHIRGKLNINQANTGLGLILDNAHKTEYSGKNDETEFCIVELSAEFPTKKMHIRRINEYDLSPFMRKLHCLNPSIAQLDLLI